MTIRNEPPVTNWFKCPWCGLWAKKVWSYDKPYLYAEWACGSFKHAELPWQSDNCRISELERDLDKVKSLLKKFAETVVQESNRAYWVRDWRPAVELARDIYVKILEEEG